LEHHRCPITQQLLVDPVVGEDGHIYERSALETWLSTKRTSPTTNRPMGTGITPSLAARQTVGELVESGVLDHETSLRFFSDRGRLRVAQAAIPGPDLAGARKDFERCLEHEMSPAQKRVLEFQLKSVRWMQEGAALFQEAMEVQVGIRGAEPPVDFDPGAWILDVGSAVEAAVTWPALKAMRLTKWIDLPKGARVRVVGDAAELERLCERCPVGAEAKVGWNSNMAPFAGKVCVVQKTGERSHMNYILRRELPLDSDSDVEADSERRTYSFPYDALYLLSGQS